MDKAHQVQVVSLQETTLVIDVDGVRHELELARHSQKLAEATQDQRDNLVVSP